MIVRPSEDTLTCPPPEIISAVQFYSIEIGPCADGTLYVGVQAIFWEDGQMEAMELGRVQARTRAQAINALIRVISVHQFGGRQWVLSD